MNDNRNDLTDLQLNDQLKVDPPLQEVPAPTIKPGASNQEIPQVYSKPPKKKKTMLIVVLVVILLFGVGAWYLCTQTDLFESNTKEETKKSDKKKDKNKDKDEDEDEDIKDRNDDEDEVINGSDNIELEELLKFNGIYTSGDKAIKLYPLKNENVFYIIKNINDEESTSIGFALYSGGKLIDDTWDEAVSFYISGDTLKAKVGEYPEFNGTYNKTGAYELKDLINDEYGKYDYFSNSLNGYYTMNDDDMYAFQMDEDTVRIIILSKESFSSFDVEFDLVDATTAKVDFFDEVYTVKFNGDTVEFTTEGEKHEHDGTYKKEGTINIEELLEIGIY